MRNAFVAGCRGVETGWRLSVTPVIGSRCNRCARRAERRRGAREWRLLAGDSSGIGVRCGCQPHANRAKIAASGSGCACLGSTTSFLNWIAMYSESIGSRKTLGDVDVVYHAGLYHLFHLVLPNHDFIAHAVSEDGFSWRRCQNAIFIGHPGSWDDSMLWTMHVSRDPFIPGRWRMFYTGLARRDRGLKQRIGMAVSDDLYEWRKSPVAWDKRSSEASPMHLEASCLQAPIDRRSGFPIEPDQRFYESRLDEGRHWISWRDPFYYREGDHGWLLCSGRVNEGPVVRRGCVALLKEVSEDQFENQPPLHHPGVYDDIEVPNLLRLDGQYYLIGSIREDAKIRYWYTDKIGNPWRTHHDNVLLPKGNYAGRICHDEQGTLIWNFFTDNVKDRTVQNLMPPPKRLFRTADGMLSVRSFERFDDRVVRQGDTSRLEPIIKTRTGYFGEPKDHISTTDDGLHLESHFGFQAFVFPEDTSCFRLTTTLRLCGFGKCGIVFRFGRQTHDGYYLSLDLLKGIAQLRSWGTNLESTGEFMMDFHSIQAGFWRNDTPGQADVSVLAFGSYIEVTIDGRVMLSLSDQRYQTGSLGVYVESAAIDVCNPCLEHLRSPTQSDEHLTVG